MTKPGEGVYKEQKMQVLSTKFETVCLIHAEAVHFGVFTQPAFAQDATKVDSAHYKVDLENDQVRVLRISYGPNEKGVMHEHPASLAVFLTGGKGQFTYPDGKTEEISWKAGQTIWLPATKHQPENLTDKPFELIQIEFKVKKAMTGKK